MEGESNWVVNGIILVALIILSVPIVGNLTDDPPAFVLWMVIMYVVYTAFSGEAIDPPHPK